MEKQVTKLIRSVKENNYMLMQSEGSEEDDFIRSQVVAINNFNAFIHKGGFSKKEKDFLSKVSDEQLENLGELQI